MFNIQTEEDSVVHGVGSGGAAPRRCIGVRVDKGELLYVVVEGPSAKPRLIRKDRIRAPKACESYGQRLNLLLDGIKNVVELSEADIAAMEIISEFNPHLGTGRVLNKTMGDTLRTEGAIIGFMHAQFPIYRASRMRDYIRLIHETKLEAVVGKGAPTFRDVVGWDKLASHYRGLVVASTALMESLGG